MGYITGYKVFKKYTNAKRANILLKGRRVLLKGKTLKGKSP
jgi:hypothetical protein